MRRASVSRIVVLSDIAVPQFHLAPANSTRRAVNEMTFWKQTTSQTRQIVSLQYDQHNEAAKAHILLISTVQS